MKKVFLGLAFLTAVLTACPGAGAPNVFSGALELPAGSAFNTAVRFDVGACFVVNDSCDPTNANTKRVPINAKAGDTKVSFSITDVKPGKYFIVLVDQNEQAIGGLIDAQEKFISISPPNTNLKVIIAPSQLQSSILEQN